MPVMYGPGIRDPKKMQEREISDNDVQAYVAIGWKVGPLPKGAKVEDVEVPVSTTPLAEPIEVEGDGKSLGKSAKKGAGKGKAKK